MYCGNITFRVQPYRVNLEGFNPKVQGFYL